MSEVPQTRRASPAQTRASRVIVALATLAAFTVAWSGPSAAATRQDAGVYRFSDGTAVPGAWSTLSTDERGAHMTLHTSDLPPAHTLTVWWVIFNEPEHCTHPEAGLRCGPGDLPVFGGDDSAVTSVVYAAGHEVGGSGQTAFAATLAAGDMSGALWGPGLANPETADIHLVVHDHGVLLPSERAEGIHNFGPCHPCVDLQYSPHEQTL